MRLVARGLFCAVALSAGASAQQRASTFEVGAAMGRHFGGTFAVGSNEYFDRSVESDTSISTVVRIVYAVSPSLSISLSGERVDTRFIETGEGVFASRPKRGDLQMRFIEAGVDYTLLKGRFTPFVGAGAGLAVLDPDIPGREDVRDSNRLALHLEAGVKAYVFRWFLFRLNVRPRFVYLGTRGLGEDKGAFDTGRWFRHIDADAGLSFVF